MSIKLKSYELFLHRYTVHWITHITPFKKLNDILSGHLSCKLSAPRFSRTGKFTVRRRPLRCYANTHTHRVCGQLLHHCTFHVLSRSLPFHEGLSTAVEIFTAPPNHRRAKQSRTDQARHVTVTASALGCGSDARPPTCHQADRFVGPASAFTSFVRQWNSGAENRFGCVCCFKVLVVSPWWSTIATLLSFACKDR